MIREIRQQVEFVLWWRAAAHRNGEGLQNGADLTLARKHVGWLHKKGKVDQANLLTTSLAGGIWPQSRKCDEGLIEEATCPNCLTESQDDFHLIWGCSKLQECEHPAIMKTNHLIPKARTSYKELPCYWLRGVTPKSWTHRKNEELVESMRGVAGRHPKDEFDPCKGTYLDGSGGIYSIWQL